MDIASERTADCASLIRSKLERQELPTEMAQRMWGGYGNGYRCDGCGRPISQREVEYELEFPLSASQHTVRLHRGCCAIWNAERVAI
jgi:hypothetical protein